MPILSTADSRRPIVVDAAIRRFADAGYHGTTIADVAREAGISPAYVAKLFSSKERLFVDALTACMERIVETLEAGAAGAGDHADADRLLDAMGGAYARLIADRSLLLLQVHAQSVAAVPEIGTALRAGLERVTTFVQERSGADDDAVQLFMARGQLCHLIVTTGIGDDAHWSSLLTRGIRHDA